MERTTSTVEVIRTGELAVLAAVVFMAERLKRAGAVSEGLVASAEDMGAAVAGTAENRVAARTQD